MKQTVRQTEAYDLAWGTLGLMGEAGRAMRSAQFAVAADPVLILPQRAETIVCWIFTIAHVNATHPSSELDVVSVLSKNLSPVWLCEWWRSWLQTHGQTFVQRAELEPAKGDSGVKR